MWPPRHPEARLKARLTDSKPIVDAFFTWCDEEAGRGLDEPPTAKAIGYARNQRIALQRFLDDGRLPYTTTAPSASAAEKPSGGASRLWPPL